MCVPARTTLCSPYLPRAQKQGVLKLQQSSPALALQVCGLLTCKECPAEYEWPVSVFPKQLLLVAPVDEAVSSGQVVVVAKDVMDVPASHNRKAPNRRACTGEANRCVCMCP